MTEIDETRGFLTVRRLHATSQEGIERDAARYRWLRDRMEVHYEVPISGRGNRATLAMRLGHEFLDCKMPPAGGWVAQRYFDECRDKLDAAIDEALGYLAMDEAR
jgi:hypothetical protein